MSTIVIAAAGLAEMSPKDNYWFFPIAIAQVVLFLIVMTVPLLASAALLWRLCLLPFWCVLRGKPIP